jgi:hypothetical protein
MSMSQRGALSAARWAAAVTDLDPQPMHRVSSAQLPLGVVWVGPDSRWANPFGCGSDAAVVAYAVWLAGRAELLAAARSALAGRDLACACPVGVACHRDALLEVANPPVDPYPGGGRVLGLTGRRPWVSLMLVPEELGGKTVENRSWATDYRGPIALNAGARVDEAGVAAAERAGFDVRWHAEQGGWLGAAVLVDVHPARRRCCEPWGHSGRANKPCYHWVFRGSARLALPTRGRGFTGLRPVSWSVLVRRRALGLLPREPQ